MIKRCCCFQRYVVTAAHCLYAGKELMTLKGGAKFRVMLGEHDHCKVADFPAVFLHIFNFDICHEIITTAR